MDNILKNNKRLLKRIKSFVLVFSGTFILALGTAAFLIPFELVAGGISGIAIALSELIDGSAFITEAIITTLTWGTFIMGLLFIGKSFALKTLLSTALYPLFITLIIESGIGDYLSGILPNNFGYVTASLLGGALVGIGLGLSFLGGGSTGGVDIIALVISKRIPRLKIPRVILAIDFAIILFGAFVTRDIKLTLFGILSAAAAASVIEFIFGEKKEKTKVK